MNHTQTLEPEFKYQYIPYKDQSNIALYDTTNRYDDYYTLFSPHRYAGIDRIANINMATFGLTSRLLDAHDREVFRAALAQGYNFSDNRVKLRQTDTLSTNPRSPLEALIDVVPLLVCLSMLRLNIILTVMSSIPTVVLPDTPILLQVTC